MEDEPENWVALEMGHLLENLVAKIFHKKSRLEIYQIKKMFQHLKYPFMLADDDYFVRLPDGTTAILEIKTTNYNAKDHWWEDGKQILGSVQRYCGPADKKAPVVNESPNPPAMLGRIE